MGGDSGVLPPHRDDKVGKCEQAVASKILADAAQLPPSIFQLVDLNSDWRSGQHKGCSGGDGRSEAYMEAVWFPDTPDVDRFVITASGYDLRRVPPNRHTVYIASVGHKILCTEAG